MVIQPVSLEWSLVDRMPSSDAITSGSVLPEHLQDGGVSELALFHLPLPAWPITSLRCRWSVDGGRAWALTPDRSIRPVRASASPPFPAGNWVVVETARGLFQYVFPWGKSLSLRHDGRRITVEAMVLQAAACGYFTVPGKSPASPGSSNLTLKVFCHPLRTLDDCLWLEPFPGGAPTVVCLTDHPDFDTMEKLALLTPVLENSELHFTKAVFPCSSDQGEKREPGLDVPRYAALIERLHQSGSEIACHGFGPRYHAPPRAECQRRLGYLQRFRPVTWIDHGAGPYLFAGGAHLADGTPLLDLLTPYGIVNFWSYVDLWSNPFLSISTLPFHAGRHLFGDFLVGGGLSRAWAHPRRLAYLCCHAIKSLCGDTGYAALRSGTLTRTTWHTVVREAKIAHGLHRAPAVLYGEDGGGVPQAADRRCLFDTICINHPAIQLHKTSLDRLAREPGIVLGHTYLTCLRRGGFGNSLTAGKGTRLRVNPVFVAALEALASRQARGELSTLPLSSLRHCLAAQQAASLVRSPTGWRFANPTPAQAAATPIIAGTRATIQGLQAGDESRRNFRGNVGFLSGGSTGRPLELSW